MIDKLSCAIANNLTKHDIIDQEDFENYQFGIQLCLLIFLNVVTTTAIALTFKMLFETVVFMVVLIPLRTYAGGYHAKTQMRCYFLSIVIIAAYLLTIKFIPLDNFIWLVFLLFSSTVTFILAPVEDKNKPLSQKEKAVYKKRTYTIQGILALIALTCRLIGQEQISSCIIIALLVLAIMLIFGKIKNVFNTFQSTRNDVRIN